MIPKKKSSVMFKPLGKKKKKNTPKNATGGKTVAVNAVMEESLKEMGVMKNNRSTNIENTQRVTSNANSDNIEKVDESYPIEDKNSNDNREDVGQHFEINKTGNNSTTKCHNSGSVNMVEPNRKQGGSNTKSNSLPSEIKKYPGIQVVVDLSGYNIEEKRMQDHGRMIEEGIGNSNMSISDNSDETRNKQPDDPAEAHLKEISI
ncbi:hypothetical protein A4A49_36294 [Nicotiana attenuata]|uniref:Uncharacterized protein n=1 Tax=Nicotiana attenuata TaxID=49451 RepID=A0A1J6KBR3_NICAT|nr:hypothetical protein A4A49_36294 [Nicotiana attenuata]